MEKKRKRTIEKNDLVIFNYAGEECEATVLAKHNTSKPLPYFIKITTGKGAGLTSWCNRCDLKLKP